MGCWRSVQQTATAEELSAIKFHGSHVEYEGAQLSAIKFHGSHGEYEGEVYVRADVSCDSCGKFGKNQWKIVGGRVVLTYGKLWVDSPLFCDKECYQQFLARQK